MLLRTEGLGESIRVLALVYIFKEKVVGMFVYLVWYILGLEVSFAFYLGDLVLEVGFKI